VKRALCRRIAGAFILALLPVTLLLAAPVVHLDPPTPILGKPLSIIITLEDEETVLAGLPDLSPFEPLAPPLHRGQEIRLVVLPMRPGEREIPPFPLQVGTARQIETAALRVTVLEGIAKDAAIAPLKRRPFPLVGSGPGSWILVAVIVLLLLGTSAALFWRWWWQRPNFFKLSQSVQLAQLAARAGQLQPSPARSRLRAEIDERRFAPLVSTADDISRLHSQLLSLLAAEGK
jgi:hypothetical protein